MKPQLLKFVTGSAQSFSVRQDKEPNINNRWHYHKELELIHFHRGSGTQFVGDKISRFHAGDVVLVGSNLPHYWRYDDTYLQQKEVHVYSTVVHFTENFWGDAFLNLPELTQLKSFFKKAKQGILVRGDAAKKIRNHIEKIYASEGFMRIISLAECLQFFLQISEPVLLSSFGFKYEFSEGENERINTIYNYALKNFNKKIYLEEIAAEAKMVPNSFCRYFKSRTGKTFSQFLIEIRVGHACRLLLENKNSIKKIAFESGFNNFTCFHKFFKQITGKTPQHFQNEYLSK